MADWEFQYRGLTFGGAQDIGIRTVEGLSPTDVKLDDISRAVDHGSWAFGDYVMSRRILISGDIRDATETKVDQWREAFARPATSPQPLVFTLPGAVQKRVNCIPIRRSFIMDPMYSIGYATWLVELLAQDPRIYAETASTLIATGTAANAGKFPTYPVVEVTGASTNPRITNSTTGEFLEVTMALGAGAILTIDFQKRTIYENTTSRYDDLHEDSTWFDLEPGNNAIVFSGGGSFVMSWRSAWL